MHRLAKYKAKKCAHFRPIRMTKHLQSARSIRITSKNDDLATDNHLWPEDLMGIKRVHFYVFGAPLPLQFELCRLVLELITLIHLLSYSLILTYSFEIIYRRNKWWRSRFTSSEKTELVSTVQSRCEILESTPIRADVR